MVLAIKRYLKFILLPGKAIVLLITIGACLQVGAFAQDRHTIDSLKSLLRNNNDTVEYETLVAMTRIYADSYHEDDSALLVARRSNSIAYRLGDTTRIVVSGRNVGMLLFRLSKPEESLDVLSVVFPMAVRHSLKSEQTAMLNIFGIVYSYRSQYDSAMMIYYQVLKLVEELDDKSKVSLMFNNIGVIYYKLFNYKKAANYFRLALRQNEKLKDDFDSDRFLINLSLCYSFRANIDMRNLDTARSCLEKAYKVCSSNCRKKIITEGEFAKGIIELKLSNYRDAKAYFQRSYAMATQSNDRHFELENLVCLAELSLKEERMDEAERYLRISEKTPSRKIFKMSELKTYYFFSLLYKIKHDNKKWLFYQTKYISLRDSIYNETLNQNLAVTQIEFEQRENKAKLESQSEMILLHEQSINRQKTINYLAGIATVLLLFLLIVLYVNNRTKKSEGSELEAKVKERTRELEDSYEFLHKTYTEQRHRVAGVIDDVKGAMSTFDGLCILLMQDTSIIQLQKIEKPADDLAAAVRLFAETVDVQRRP